VTPFNAIALPVLGSPLTEPLEVVGVLLAFVGVIGGAAGAAELLSGQSGREIQDAAAKGAAAAFLIGFVAAVAFALYLVLSGS
jgi:hypothetical protein